jgi:hypothetical protein
VARPRYRRYLTAEWEAERVAQKLTDCEVVERTRLRYQSALANGVSERQVERLALDDPFISDHASAQQLWMATRKKATR